MSNQSDRILHAIVHRLVTINPHLSDDEKRDLHRSLADAAEDIENPKTQAEIDAEAAAVKEAKRAELQAAIDAL